MIHLARRLKSVMLTPLLFTLFFVVLFTPSAISASPTLFSEAFTAFTGAGFAPEPTAGQLDSDMWIASGFDGAEDMNFGDTRTLVGDFARGSSNGGVTTGGIYAFNTGGNVILGVQPGGSDFTPGSFTLRLQNLSGVTITSVDIEYDIFYYNDQNRANSLNLSYSIDNASYTPVSALDFTTLEAADTSPVWQSVSRSTTLSSLNLADGDFFYLQWTGDDVSGTGSRDEYGIDNISVTNLSAPTAVTLNSFTATEAEDHVQVAWETVSELDNLGFNLYRSTDPTEVGERLNEELIPSQAPGSGQGFLYEWADYGVSAGVTYYYWLEDVDFAGQTTLHGPVSLFFNPSPTALTLDALSASPSAPRWGGAAALLLTGLAGVALHRRRR